MFILLLSSPFYTNAEAMDGNDWIAVLKESTSIVEAVTTLILIVETLVHFSKDRSCDSASSHSNVRGRGKSEREMEKISHVGT